MAGFKGERRTAMGGRKAVRLSPLAYRLSSLLILISVVCLLSSALHAQDSSGLASAVKRTGLDVPRWASLRSDEVNMRAGPGQRYPIIWVYRRKGMPIEITAEFDTWRRVRDAKGDEGWVHKATLSGKRTAIVTGKDVQILLRDKDDPARIRAQIEPGVQGELLKCDSLWCRMNFDGVRGYLKREALWGLYAKEKID